MCKNMMIAGLKYEKSEQLWKFLMAATPFMTDNDKDGLGYVAQSPSGLWGERWLYPKEAWLEASRKKFTPGDEAVKSRFKGALIGEPSFNEFGEVASDKTHAILFHARMATCEKNLANVHPFVIGDTGMIHNGVIRNHADKDMKKLISTCDSEVILNKYLDHGVSDDPEAIAEFTHRLDGYYACGFLTKDEKGNQYMDIFKNATANLYAAYVKPLDAVVYCTSDEILRKTCSKLKWSMGYVFKFKENILVRINAVTGDLISTHKFDSYSYAKNYAYNNSTQGKSSDYNSHWDNDSAWGEEGKYITQSDIDRNQAKLDDNLQREVMGYEKKSEGTTIKEETTDSITPFTPEEIVAKLDKELLDISDEVSKILEADLKAEDEAILKDPHGVKCEGFGKS